MMFGILILFLLPHYHILVTTFMNSLFDLKNMLDYQAVLNQKNRTIKLSRL